ncbi:hypothetical protein DIURU_004790 [Diutina rugosa]|uniref:ABC transporter domain-containing protein n=1 Tax=Diutina rugosa TaxID=5481 RepID=A0A642UHL8_DIURU|nr:uncharacterized protein DIURU_004790 [Diutina rugosa]KAA8897937.1 hypothetical protein DIURU_004790 [Diutina rugosa]
MADDSEEPRYHGFEDHDDIKDFASQVNHDPRLAQINQKRRASMVSSVGGGADDVENNVSKFFSTEADPRLDPNSEQFDSKYWMEQVRNLFESNADYFKPSTMGVAYRNLSVKGASTASDYQQTVSNYFPKLLSALWDKVKPKKYKEYFNILNPMDAIMESGSMTVVLGRPGAGCSTLLKTVAAQTYGFTVDPKSEITYDGLTPKDIQTHLRGDIIFSAESDIHFPKLTVGETLEFAARMRTPKNRGPGVNREEYASYMASVVMATFGLLHTRNTYVGNNFIRGVSGGERKRVSIAEACLNGSILQCWDNATRGLDSATALEFCKALRTAAKVLGITSLVAIYQCSEEAYRQFDNVVLLYKGRQIYYGSTADAKEFFIHQGWECPSRSTTADFLTSLTNPAERQVREGYEGKVPQTPEEMEQYFLQSDHYKRLKERVDSYIDGVSRDEAVDRIGGAHRAQQADHLKKTSPFTVNFAMQTKYLVIRNFQRIRNDPSVDLFSIGAQIVMALILSSVFYNQQRITNSFYFRGAAIFFAVLYNAFSSLLEIMAMFESRQIVEKQRAFAMYHVSADAIASIISSFPTKVMMSLGFNIIFYFMVNLRRNPGNFFFYLLMTFMCTMIMSHLFRTIGAISNSIAQAMTPASVILLGIVVFTGFVITWPTMLKWTKWIFWINPVHYIFESLMLNEFHNREFDCSVFVPSGGPYDNADPMSRSCSAVGSVPGRTTVQGTDFLRLSYNFYNAHKWRNFGIAWGFLLLFLCTYLLLTELNPGVRSRGEVAVFKHSAMRKAKKLAKQKNTDVETLGNKMTTKENAEYVEEEPNEVQIGGEFFQKPTMQDDGFPSGQIFFWDSLTYQIKIKSEQRVILDHVDGWVKPGTLTALMGASGAGKTTLLNCLSDRVTTGQITDGSRYINGRPLDSSFQRQIGYVQQEDLHLPKSTVRESLQFSAYLRQPPSVSKKEKNAWVEQIIDLLEMRAYADAMVGKTGSGLNVEQRKRLSIGVELAAKPKVLLFLDEPTSGLDSQTAWSVCKLMRKLADYGQSILCTIHQPSAVLMQSFDRLLFMQKGGKTVYFGDLGPDCQTMVKYFENHGSHPCPPDANPADWMLEVVGAAPGSHANQDYHEVWNNSDECRAVKQELAEMRERLVSRPVDDSKESKQKYAMPMWAQFNAELRRTVTQIWRNPEYIYSKYFLIISCYIANGFFFFNYSKDNNLQSLQNQMYSVMMSYNNFPTIIQQMLPGFIEQREIYEVRELPSRTFSWWAFFTAQVLSELPFQFIAGTLAFCCYYWPVGFYRNAEVTHTARERGALFWLLVVSFNIFCTTMGHLCISFMESDQNASNLAVILLTMCLTFCGVLAGPNVLPGFWIFMYRCNPLTYLIQSQLATGLAHAPMHCSEAEFVHFNAPEGMNCGDYMKDFLSAAGGFLEDASATSCKYCQFDNTNDWLASVNVKYSTRWWYLGIFWAFPVFNVFAGAILYYIFRVPKGNKMKNKGGEKPPPPPPKAAPITEKSNNQLTSSSDETVT